MNYLRRQRRLADRGMRDALPERERRCANQGRERSDERDAPRRRGRAIADGFSRRQLHLGLGVQSYLRQSRPADRPHEFLEGLVAHVEDGHSHHRVGTGVTRAGLTVNSGQRELAREKSRPRPRLTPHLSLTKARGLTGRATGHTNEPKPGRNRLFLAQPVGRASHTAPPSCSGISEGFPIGDAGGQP